MINPQSLQMLLALALGFAVAGLCASGYRLATSRLPTVGLISAGPRVSAFATLPLLILSAPFLIMRSTFLARGDETRRFEFVFMATLVAGFWSLMSGIALVTTLQAFGLFA